MLSVVDLQCSVRVVDLQCREWYSFTGAGTSLWSGEQRRKTFPSKSLMIMRCRNTERQKVEQQGRYDIPYFIVDWLI